MVVLPIPRSASTSLPSVSMSPGSASTFAPTQEPGARGRGWFGAVACAPAPGRYVAWVLVGWTVVAASGIALGAGSIDLAVYLRAASDLAAGRDPNLTPPSQLPWLYPPFAAAGYLPLLVLPFPVASVVVAIVSVAALARTLHLVLVRLGRPHLTLVALAASIAVEPVYATLGYGQINLVVAWLVTEGLLGRRRWLVGVAAAIKLTPLIFVLPLLVRRDLRGAGETAAGFVIAGAVGWLVAPQASTTYWSGLFLAASDRIGIAYATNQSLSGTLWRAAGDGGIPVLSGVLSVTVVLVTAALLRRSDTDDVLALSVTGLAGLLVSPISWIHHWVWILPLGLWLFVHGRRRLALAWGVLLVGRVTWWYPAGGHVEYTHDLLGKLAQDSWSILAIVTLGVLAASGPRAPRTVSSIGVGGGDVRSGRGPGDPDGAGMPDAVERAGVER